MDLIIKSVLRRRKLIIIELFRDLNQRLINHS